MPNPTTLAAQDIEYSLCDRARAAVAVCLADMLSRVFSQNGWHLAYTSGDDLGSHSSLNLCYQNHCIQLAGWRGEVGCRLGGSILLAVVKSISTPLTVRLDSPPEELAAQIRVVGQDMLAYWALENVDPRIAMYLGQEQLGTFQLRSQWYDFLSSIELERLKRYKLNA